MTGVLVGEDDELATSRLCGSAHRPISFHKRGNAQTPPLKERMLRWRQLRPNRGPRPSAPEQCVAISTKAFSLTSNLLLASMKPATRNALLRDLVPIELELGATLYEEGEPQNLLYFPISGIVSLLYTMRNGNSAEMAIVGSDGLVGFAAVLGGRSTTTRALVQVAGAAFALKRRPFIRLMDEDKHLRQLMMCYTQSLLTQFAQTAVCNRHHSIEQQWCRWMLMSLDRSSQHPIRMTQQLIADMLGVRREGVSMAATALKSAGVINYARGVISVVDRRRLEERVCECYALVVRETERLLPGSNRRR